MFYWQQLVGGFAAPRSVSLPHRNRLRVIVDLVDDVESSLVAGVDGLSAVDEAIAKFSDYQL